MKIKKFFAILTIFPLIFINLPFTISNVSAEETGEIAVWDGTNDTFWFQEGENEFKISTAEELSGLAKLVNSGNDFAGITIVLENDIYLNDTSDIEKWNKNYLNSFEEDDDSIIPSNKWIPIGKNSSNPFCGIFDGNGHSVNGIYCINNRQSGLFGWLKGDAVIKNLTIGSGFVHGLTETGGIVGGAYFESNTQILNCINKCEILTYSATYSTDAIRTNTFQLYAGGITGYGGFITNCANYGHVSTLIPEAYRSYYYGRVTDIRGEACSGGITGGNSYQKSINDCCNYGTVYSECEEISKEEYSAASLLCAYSGGIVGLGGSHLNNCYNAGTVKSKGYSTIVGGICCQDASEINSCYNVGTLQTPELSETHTSSLTGGIIGKLDTYANTSITNSYYLDTSAERGIGDVEEDTIIKLNQSAMKKEVFAKTLGEAYVYVEGDYPKLAWEDKVAEFSWKNVVLNEYNQQTNLELMTNYTGIPVWISSDKNVATVENGTITAKNNGECIIYAVCGDVRAVCNVTVNYGYTLNKTNIEINEDETAQLSVISDNTKSEAEGFEIVWASSDENVVTIENGVVKAVSGGTAMVTASFGNVSLECKVIVNVLIPEPELNITSTEMYEGETEKLIVNNYTGNITWISNNAEVAKVENGIVKAIAPGNANIYAMLSNGTNLICAVTVNEAKVTSVVTTNVTTVITTTVTTVSQTTQTEEATSITTTNVTTTPFPTSESNGDVNDDGKFNISDVIMLQKWLVGAGELTDWKAGDLCKDNKINVFDLCLMKRKLIEMK